MELSNGFLTARLFAMDEPSFLVQIGNYLWIGLAVAIGIGLVVFIHELGHFLAAKLFGVKVEKFYVGFDVPISIFGIQLPRHLGRFRWGETEYGIGLIPLGGYVKMLGQDDDPRQAARERERIQLKGGDATEGDVRTEHLDPRSFPAKSVWQRMVIISAGVVMNLLTSILFGAIAFGFGVPFTPAIVGDTIVGYPGWEAGIEPGGRVVSVGSISRDEKLGYQEMLVQIMTASLADPEQPVRVELQYPGDVRSVDLKPRELPGDSRVRMVGFRSPPSNLLGESIVCKPLSPAADVLTKEDRGAEIVEFDGTALGSAANSLSPLGSSLTQYLALQRGGDVRLTLKRKDQSQVVVTVPPQKMKTFGVRFALGRVSALVRGGPAETAGVKVGDEVLGVSGVDGELDAIRFPGWVSEHTSSSKELLLRIRREGGEEQEIAVACGDELPGGVPMSVESGQVEVTQLGLAYYPTGEILGVEAGYDAGANAVAEGLSSLQSGDLLRRVTFQAVNDQETLKVLEKIVSERARELLFQSGWQITPKENLVQLMEMVQMLPVGTAVQLVVERGPEKAVVEIESVIGESTDYWYERGLFLQGLSEVHRATGISEAFALGLRESKRKFAEVLSFLRLLGTGRLSMRNIGGPGAIAYMAGSAASSGVGALLIFLTFLSVNLAILNFLPIPALDGGHMVFLIAEAVRGKPVNEELQVKLTMAGVLFLLSLMVFVFVNDFLNLSGGL